MLSPTRNRSSCENQRGRFFGYARQYSANVSFRDTFIAYTMVFPPRPRPTTQSPGCATRRMTGLQHATVLQPKNGLGVKPESWVRM